MMTETTEGWLENHADRTFARQRAQVDTAKLLATFAAGIAATLVATALQVGDPEQLDRISAWLLAVTFLAAIMVIMLDRIAEANQSQTLELSALGKWDDERLLFELRRATLKAVFSNHEVVRSVKIALAVQLVFSTATGVAAATSLLT
jgi:hypothetical protein